ncbi:DNA-binding domain-containing protein [Vibrio sp. PP-XX7]
MQDQFSRSLLFEQNDILAKYIDAKSEQEKQTRFSVYRNNVFSSLIDVLGEIYPICKMVVGDEFFAALAYQYVLKNASRQSGIE